MTNGNTNTPAALTPEELRLRHRRSNAIGLTLAAFAVLFFVVSIAKFGLQTGSL